jgi:AcrR family transcriptional regulator
MTDLKQDASKRERTRARLVAATLEAVAAKGVAGASLDDIAARAGMTKGAIYSNFAGKAELLLAAMGERGLTLSSAPRVGATIEETLAGLAHDLAQAVRRASGAGALAAEFQLHALNDPEMRKAMGATYAASFAGLGRILAQASGAPSRMSPQVLAVAVQAVAMGFLVQSFITPEAIDEDLIVETFAALAAGVTGPPSAPASGPGPSG